MLLEVVAAGNVVDGAAAVLVVEVVQVESAVGISNSDDISVNITA
jgi:hypothetical protein